MGVLIVPHSSAATAFRTCTSSKTSMQCNGCAPLATSNLAARWTCSKRSVLQCAAQGNPAAAAPPSVRLGEASGAHCYKPHSLITTRRALICCSATQPSAASHHAASGASAASEHRRMQQLPVAVAVVTVVSFMSAVKAASAEDKEWHPRRHHTRMGESFTPYWMDPIIEEQIRIETERLALKEEHKRLEDERKAKLKAEREAKRQEKLRKLEEQRRQEEASQAAQQLLSNVAGLPKRLLDTASDYTGVLNLALLLLALGFLAKALFGWLGGLFGGGWRPKGRYVYDRSLGGKKVWVPYSENEPVGAPIPAPKLPPLRNDDFDMLTKIAAAARTGATVEGADSVGRAGVTAAAAAGKVPAWFQPPEAASVRVSEEVVAEKQAEADKLLRLLEQAKVKGQDYSAERLVKLRDVCQMYDISVKPSTPGGRDAMYRTGVEAAVQLSMQPESSPGVGQRSPLDFVTGLAGDLSLERSRAASIIKACAASMVRTRLVEVVVAIKKKDDLSVINELIKIASLLTNLPVLQRGDAEIDLIASTLRSRATNEELTTLLTIYYQILPEGAELMAETLGFDPDSVMPKLREDEQSRS